MRVLGLDISTHTGWALLVGEKGTQPKLLDYGLLEVSVLGIMNGVGHPQEFLKGARLMASKIKAIFQETKPDVIVVEQTNRSKNRFSQKILEFIHYCFLTTLESELEKIVYIDTSEWRKILGLKLSKEQKKNNSKVNKANRNKVSKKKLGLVGKVKVKHLSVDYCNKVYGLALLKKNDNEADAICQASAYLLK